MLKFYNNYSYCDFMNELSDDDLFKGLLGFGLFPKELDEIFTSEAFFNYIQEQYTDVSNNINIRKLKDADYIRYSTTRNINIPRQLGIPEPFNYANQCIVLSKYWNEIKEHFKNCTEGDNFKISRVHIRKLNNEDKIFEMNYSEFNKDGDPPQDLVIGSRYVVNADIANCFNSIYTHSIAWALIGKEEAKEKSKNGFKNEYFNQIDQYTRYTKYNETNGILIGPYASNLISEIILVKIDSELKKEFNFIRAIDDYKCFVKTKDEGEKFIKELTKELTKYQLSLNVKKTQVNELPQGNIESWVSRINVLKLMIEKQEVKISDLRHYLDNIVILSIENNNSAIINYGIKIIKKDVLKKDYIKSYYVKRIRALILQYPYLIKVLRKYVFDEHNISKEDIKIIAKEVYNLGYENNNYEACSYSIYWALRYNFGCVKELMML